MGVSVVTNGAAVADAPAAETLVTEAIVFRGLRKTYEALDGSIEALGPLDFGVRKGEFVSVLGPSGCGKSTLMLIAAGLDPATAGTTTIDGRVVDRPFTDLGIVFQDHALLEWRTVLDNVLLHAALRKIPERALKPAALDLLKRVGLAGFENRYPFELSGGMRQRAAICRALVHAPQFLFFDEPFGALDALTREQMRVDLEKLWLERRQTVLFITHGIAEAVALSDRIVVMTSRPGRVDRIIDIDLPRPRNSAVLASARFAEYSAEIKEIFNAAGVLKE
ncbi:MAG: ABC transporter ATP-binding protein [Alphaproteobacteria bacterium]|nr:ABC transporter ATP-binding protein [Alphaproteobacteria bacterium]